MERGNKEKDLPPLRISKIDQVNRHNFLDIVARNIEQPGRLLQSQHGKEFSRPICETFNRTYILLYIIHQIVKK